MSSKSSSTSAAAVVLNLDDLLLEILVRLPAKSLIVFKSVSKHWHALISDASFRQLHSRRHRRPETSFLLDVFFRGLFHFNPTRRISFPFDFNFDYARILQSCNGLLLLKCGLRDEDYYIYNPTTGESRNLMVPKTEHVRCLFLAFDPLKSPYYKIVCLRSATSESLLYEIEVYGSETHKWHDLNVYCNMHPPLTKWVYSDSDNSIYSLTRDRSLICFDIEKLMFQMPFFEAESQLFMFSIRESFGHVQCISHDDDMNLVVHEITKKNGGWSSEHLFTFNITPGCPAATSDEVCFFGVIRGERNDSSLVLHIAGKFMAYHFYERRFEELLDLSEYGTEGWWLSNQFVESLAPV